jgi:hypothetical protein
LSTCITRESFFTTTPRYMVAHKFILAKFKQGFIRSAISDRQ